MFFRPFPTSFLLSLTLLHLSQWCVAQQNLSTAAPPNISNSTSSNMEDDDTTSTLSNVWNKMTDAIPFIVWIIAGSVLLLLFLLGVGLCIWHRCNHTSLKEEGGLVDPILAHIDSLEDPIIPMLEAQSGPQTSVRNASLSKQLFPKGLAMNQNLNLQALPTSTKGVAYDKTISEPKVRPTSDNFSKATKRPQLSRNSQAANAALKFTALLTDKNIQAASQNPMLKPQAIVSTSPQKLSHNNKPSADDGGDLSGIPPSEDVDDVILSIAQVSDAAVYSPVMLSESELTRQNELIDQPKYQSEQERKWQVRESDVFSDYGSSRSSIFSLNSSIRTSKNSSLGSSDTN